MRFDSYTDEANTTATVRGDYGTFVATPERFGFRVEVLDEVTDGENVTVRLGRPGSLSFSGYSPEQAVAIEASSYPEMLEVTKAMLGL